MLKGCLSGIMLFAALLLGGMALYLAASEQQLTAIPVAIVGVGLLLAYGWMQRGVNPGKKRAAGKPLEIIRPVHPLVSAPAASAARSAQRAGPPLAIEMIRELLGPTPRGFDRGLRKYLRVEPPPWLKPKSEPELAGMYERQEKIRAEGKVVWAALVQANSLLFKPGTADHPASVVYSDDAAFDAQPTVLQKIAREVGSLKGHDQADPEADSIARVLTNELIRGSKHPLPARITGRRPVYHSSIVIVRQHLPKGYLTGSIMPVWMDPADDGTLLLVPAAYWPPSLLNQWGE